MLLGLQLGFSIIILPVPFSFIGFIFSLVTLIVTGWVTVGPRSACLLICIKGEREEYLSKLNISPGLPSD